MIILYSALYFLFKGFCLFATPLVLRMLLFLVLLLSPKLIHCLFVLDIVHALHIVGTNAAKLKANQWFRWGIGTVQDRSEID